MPDRCGDLIVGDCVEEMQSLPGESVHLTVTSPPYNCGKRYATGTDDLTWDEYWMNTDRWLREVYRVTAAGCRLAVNLPWWMGKKPRRDVPFEFKQRAAAVGWRFLDKVIWIKGRDAAGVHTSGGFGGNGSGWGTYLSPSGPSIRCASEPILIFAKGGRGRRVLSGAGRGACVQNDITKEEWMVYTLDVWFVAGTSCRNHPAVFPLEIPRRLIKLYTYPGETVLDPMAGSGTTCLAADQLNRGYIGIDTAGEYVDYARKRLEKEREKVEVGA